MKSLLPETMFFRIFISTFLILSVATHLVSAGGPAIIPDKSPSTAEITMPDAPSRWRLGVSYAPIIGLKTEFSGLGTFNPAFNSKPLGGGVDYNYDNGFVRVDSSDNYDHQTWNWGYADESQFNAAGSGSIDYSLSSCLANGTAKEEGGGEAGIECFGYLDMGSMKLPLLEKNTATWGFRGGFHYDRINVENQDSIYANVLTQTDRFSLGGTVPPLAPFNGSFEGPGPLIGDSPTRSYSSTGQALVTGSRDLDVHLSTFNFGTYLEIPILPKLSLMVEGGISIGFASGSYDFNSTTNIAGLGTRHSSGSDSKTSFLPGYYLGIQGIFQLDKNWGIQAGGRYQYMDEFNLDSNGSAASLSFDSAFVLSLGTVYSF
jgi:hypothetical protein